MNLPHDKQIAAWLAAGPAEAPPESLARALAATHRTRKRPRWTFPERWLPVQLTMTRTPSLRPVLAIAVLALLSVALVATALFIGSQRRQPPLPFGPARNGAVVYEQDGDLFIADQLGGTPRSLVADPETDSDPVFSPQGDRVAFIRDRARIMTVGLNGSDVRELAKPGTVIRLDWSPDASALLASTFSSEDLQALTVVQSDGSGSRTLGLDNIYTIAGAWRPDGRQIAFVGYQAGALAIFIADADGTNVRPLGVGPGASDGPDWSPNGKQLSFLGPDGITIADIAEDGAMTDVRQLKLDLDPGSTPATDPKWSPDGSQLAFALRTDFNEASRMGIADADGSGFRFVGPAGGRWRGGDFIWSPDGQSLIIGGQGRDPGDRTRVARDAWSVDVATGEQTEVQTPVQSWQRLGP